MHRPGLPRADSQTVGVLCGRDQMDIENLGPAIIGQLVAKGLVHHFADLYRLKKEDIIGLELGEHVREDGRGITQRIQEGLATKLIAEIEASKGRGFRRVLASIGIPLLGSTNADRLVSEFSTIEAIRSATEERLLKFFKAVAGIGIPKKVRYDLDHPGRRTAIEAMKNEGKTITDSYRLRGLVGDKRANYLGEHFGEDWDRLLSASEAEIRLALKIKEEEASMIGKSVFTFLQKDFGRKEIDELLEVGVKMERDVRAEPPRGTGPLASMTVVVTGTLEQFSRKDAEHAIERAGGKVESLYQGTPILWLLVKTQDQKQTRRMNLGWR